MAQADVSSRDISFIRGITRKAEKALLTIAADDVVVRVGQPQAGSPFGWKASPPGGWVVPSSRPQAAPGARPLRAQPDREDWGGWEAVLVGTGGAFVVREQEGTLFLGINDPNPGDNWGDGFTCMITQMR